MCKMRKNLGDLFIFLFWISSDVASGQRISTRFFNGSLNFTWYSRPGMRHSVKIIKDLTHTNWMQVEDGMYTVKDVLNYTTVTIYVNEQDTFSNKSKNFKETFNVTLVKAEEGDATNISWTIYSLPKIGVYYIYHAYNGTVRKLMEISEDGIFSRNYKYIYHSRLIYSFNIQLEVRNITTRDCGYYFAGVTEIQSLSSQCVVLLVIGKPTLPEITGDLQVNKGNSASFTCHSRSTSTPGYYKKFPPLSYIWYINNNEMIGYTDKTYRFLASKNERNIVISCRAKETLESARSKEIVIDILYGPDREDIKISPAVPSGEIYLNDGATFGPYNCTVDCNPPCKVQWMVKRSNGNFSYFANASSLEYTLATITERRVYRGNATLFLCVAYGSAFKNENKSIKLDIQYLAQPKLCINGIAKNLSNVQENSTLHFSCYVEGNPSPTIILSRGPWKQVIKWSFGNLLNNTFVKKAQCSDSNTYRCEGSSDAFPAKSTTLGITVMLQTIQIGNSESQRNILITVGVLGSLLLLLMTAFGVYKFLHRAEIPVSPGHPTPASRDVITSTKMNEGTHDDAMDAHERHEAPLDKNTSVDNERYKEIHGENIAVLPMYNQNITCIRDENNQYEELKP